MIMVAIVHRDQSGSLAGADGDWVPFHRIKRDDVDFCQNQVLFRAAEVQICFELIEKWTVELNIALKKDPLVYDFLSSFRFANLVLAGHSLVALSL